MHAHFFFAARGHAPPVRGNPWQQCACAYSGCSGHWLPGFDLPNSPAKVEGLRKRLVGHCARPPSPLNSPRICQWPWHGRSSSAVVVRRGCAALAAPSLLCKILFQPWRRNCRPRRCVCRGSPITAVVVGCRGQSVGVGVLQPSDLRRFNQSCMIPAVATQRLLVFSSLQLAWLCGLLAQGVILQLDNCSSSPLGKPYRSSCASSVNLFLLLFSSTRASESCSKSPLGHCGA